jgi:hypothetical protein
MQVTVEIRIEPKPRAHGPIVCGRCRKSSAPEDPPRAAIFNGGFEQRVSGESAPGLQLRANAFFVTENRDQIAGAASAQDLDQLQQET